MRCDSSFLKLQIKIRFWIDLSLRIDLSLKVAVANCTGYENNDTIAIIEHFGRICRVL